jgi:hypothetical protein
VKAFHLFLLLIGLVFVATSFPYSTGRIAYPTPHSYFEARVNLAEEEQPRIQRHLAAVEAILRARSTAGLSESQRRNRLARLDDLHEYWTRGEFPQNLDFPNRLIPYFIDAKGVPCAMGYLVIQSGHEDFAEEIRVRMNNAYIGEIAAVDNRLAEWGDVNGMTLEEAAMVQPGYGAPRIGAILQIRLDSLLRPWVFGPDHNNIGGSAIFYQDSSKWKLHLGYDALTGFCLTPSGQPLVLKYSSVLWKGREYSIPAPPNSFGYPTFPCDWNVQGTEAWVPTLQGLIRLTRGGTNDSLARMRFSTPLASDTVTGVAVNPSGIWATTPQGIYRRSVPIMDTVVTVWDSTTLGGRRVTGLKAGVGNYVWAGVEGISNGSTTSFSTRGILRHNGTVWNRYVSTMSSVFVPSDTVLALAIRDTATVWIAVRSGFYRFPSTSGSGKVADIPSGGTIYEMVGNTQGFYASTSSGLYQFRNDSLVFIWNPTSLRPAMAGKGLQTGPRLRVLSAHEAKALGNARSVLGQKTGPQAGAGVYLLPD